MRCPGTETLGCLGVCLAGREVLRRTTFNRSVVTVFVVLLTIALPAEDAPLSGFEQWTSKSLAPVIADLAAEAPSDPHRFAMRQLADYPNDGFLLVHRTADGAGEWHETQADVFFVQSGTATLLLGGK